MTHDNQHKETKPDPDEVAKATKLLIQGVAKSRKVKSAMLVTFSVAFSFLCYMLFSDLMIGRMNAHHRAEAVKECDLKGKQAFTAQSLNSDGTAGEDFVFCISKDDVSTKTSGLNTMLKKPAPRGDH